MRLIESDLEMAPLRGAFFIPIGPSGKHLGPKGNIWVVRDTFGYLSDGRTAGRSDGRSDGECLGPKK